MLSTGAITTDGRSLLAAATVSNKIIFTSGLSDTVYKDATTIINTTSTTPSMGALVGTIFRTTYHSATQSAEVTVRFTNSGAGMTIYGAWIKARLESNPTEKLFAALMDEDGFYIPNTSNIDSYVDITFQMTFTDLGGDVHIVEDGAVTQNDLNAAINGVKAHSLDINRTYDNFLLAQAYCKEGCGFAVNPNGPKKFALIITSWEHGTPDSWRVSDIYDQYIAVVAVKSNYTYMYIYDILQGTISGETITFNSAHVHGRLGDENSTDGNATILKVSDKYFACCYANDGTTNEWWYNQDYGQTSTNKVIGRAAVTPINTFVNNTFTFTKGWWYAVGNGSTNAIRAIGGPYALWTDDISDGNSGLKFCKMRLSGGQTKPLTYYFSQLYTYLDIDAYCNTTPVSYAGACFVIESGEDLILLNEWWANMGVLVMIPQAIARCGGQWQIFVAGGTDPVNVTFLQNCGGGTQMLINPSEMPFNTWVTVSAGRSGSATAFEFQMGYDGVCLSCGADTGSEPASREYADAIYIKCPLDFISLPRSKYVPLAPFNINKYNFTLNAQDSSDLYAFAGEPGSFSYFGVYDSNTPLVESVVKGTQIFTYRSRIYGINNSNPFIHIQFAPNPDMRGMKKWGKI